MPCLFFLTPCLLMSDWECSLSAHTPNTASALSTPGLTFLEGSRAPNSLWVMIQTYHSFTWIQGIALKYYVSLTREDYYPVNGCWVWCWTTVVWAIVRHGLKMGAEDLERLRVLATLPKDSNLAPSCTRRCDIVFQPLNAHTCTCILKHTQGHTHINKKLEKIKNHKDLKSV